MNKLIFSIIISIVVFGSVSSQNIELNQTPISRPQPVVYQSQGVRQYYTISWSIGFPLAGFNNAGKPDYSYISKTSLAGGMLSGQAFLCQNRLGLGAAVGWNNFYQTVKRQTYTIPDRGMAITAASYNYMSSVPIKAIVTYAFLPNAGILQPYFTLGLGANYMTQHIMIQDIDIWDDNWGFMVSPEIGTYIRFGKNAMWGANVAVGYNYATNHFNLAEHVKSNGINYLNLNIGLTLMIN